MRRVGAFEAKTHLAQLLDAVARGETIEITKHGVPVAHLVPPARHRGTAIERTIDHVKALRATVEPATPSELRSWREEGRRF